MSFFRSRLTCTNQPILKLPREHGAVTVFSLATLVSLFLSFGELTRLAWALVLLWLMMVSAYDCKLLFRTTCLSILLMGLCGNLTGALFFLLVFFGIETIKSSHGVRDLWWREILGLSGAALAPLLLNGLILSNFQSTLIACLAFLASVMTGISLIHARKPELNVNPIMTAILSLFLWIWLARLNPILTMACLAPFCLQVLWLFKAVSPSFKQLGIAQAACMTTVSLAVLFLH
ncbi:MAG: hypothetical protein K2Y39_03735 [Candidatus Obscuribacterales bacterium]|nr:hypothetical protein [Candidatus Obscuribacterales bacterium]